MYTCGDFLCVGVLEHSLGFEWSEPVSGCGSAEFKYVTAAHTYGEYNIQLASIAIHVYKCNSQYDGRLAI